MEKFIQVKIDLGPSDVKDKYWTRLMHQI